MKTGKTGFDVKSLDDEGMGDRLKDSSLRQSGLLSSWAKRKQAVLREQEAEEQGAQQKEIEKEVEKEEQVLLTDADMPSIDTLTADSDYTGFMSPKVSDALRRLALRKLFHGAEFNIRDGLDDYDGDYTSFAKLGDIVTADMKHQVEMEARKRARLLEEKKAQDVLAEEGNIQENAIQDNATQDNAIQDDTDLDQDSVVKEPSAIEDKAQFEIAAVPVEATAAQDENNDVRAGSEKASHTKDLAVNIDIKNAETVTKGRENEIEDDEYDPEDDLDGGLPG